MDDDYIANRKRARARQKKQNVSRYVPNGEVQYIPIHEPGVYAVTVTPCEGGVKTLLRIAQASPEKSPKDG